MQRHLGRGPGILADWIPHPETASRWNLCQVLFDPVTLAAPFAPKNANDLIGTESHFRRAAGAGLGALGCNLALGLGALFGDGLLGGFLFGGHVVSSSFLRPSGEVGQPQP